MTGKNRWDTLISLNYDSFAPFMTEVVYTNPDKNYPIMWSITRLIIVN